MTDLDDVEEEENSNEIKVILIGDAGVGKTNLINTSSGGRFNENEKSSLSVSYMKKEVIIEEEKYILCLWDTIGQEKLRNLSKLFFENSKIVIFVYDITKKDTFKGLESWNNDVNQLLGDEIVKAIVGNKQDLFLKEEIKEEEGLKYAKSMNYKFRLTSAKTDPEGFSSFLEELLIEYLKKKRKEPKKNIKIKKKDKKKGNKDKKKFC